jgi:hypothetical protein
MDFMDALDWSFDAIFLSLAISVTLSITDDGVSWHDIESVVIVEDAVEVVRPLVEVIGDDAVGSGMEIAEEESNGSTAVEDVVVVVAFSFLFLFCREFAASVCFLASGIGTLEAIVVIGLMPWSDLIVSLIVGIFLSSSTFLLKAISFSSWPVPSASQMSFGNPVATVLQGLSALALLATVSSSICVDNDGREECKCNAAMGPMPPPPPLRSRECARSE